MSVKKSAVQAKWIIGRVIGTKMVKTAKVRVTRLVLDPYLLKVNGFFKSHVVNSTNVWKDGWCKIGLAHGVRALYFPLTTEYLCSS